MVEIKNVNVYDLYESWIASGYPMRLDFNDNYNERVNNLKVWCFNKSFLPTFVNYINTQDNKDIKFEVYKDNTVDVITKDKSFNIDCTWLPTIFRDGEPNLNYSYAINNITEHSKSKIGLWHTIQDYKRVINLHNASATSDVKCHDNWLTGVRVSFDMKYPQYISPELQRYHWIDIVSSSSKMHKLGQMTLINSCNKYVDPELIKIAQKYVDAYNEDPTYENRMLMISNCPLGLELFMRISTNYKQLQTIYFQRKNHRLKEDWGAICEMIEKLPFSKQLITGDDKK